MKLFKKRYRNQLEKWNATPDKTGSKLGHFYDRHFVDHAFIRALNRNFHALDSHVYRGAQPSPRFIKHLKAMGFKTIINLRGEHRSASYTLEKQACEQYGVTLINTKLNSRRIPEPTELKQWLSYVRECEKPMMFHCKSGADRAGIAAAMYLLIMTDQGIDAAKKQLSLRYYHLSHSKTGILDHFIDAYADFNAQNPMPFMDWYEHHCDRDAITQSFKPSTFSNWIVEKVLHRE
ncbi:tyrosine-protein phosphatase [Reinekea forsetii]|nr:tyrosine-protein phosphatase [Reinekea forsetii]